MNAIVDESSILQIAAQLSLGVVLAGLSGCAGETLPTALPVTAPVPARIPITDTIQQSSILAVRSNGDPLSTVQVKEQFLVEATIYLDERIQSPEILGVVYAMSNRPGSRVILQSALWKGRRTGVNSFTGKSTLDFQAKGYNPTVELIIDGKVVADYPMTIAD